MPWLVQGVQIGQDAINIVVSEVGKRVSSSEQHVESVDIVPEHNMHSDLGEYLQREKDQAEAMGEAFGMHAQLLRVLREASVPKRIRRAHL